MMKLWAEIHDGRREKVKEQKMKRITILVTVMQIISIAAVDAANPKPATDDQISTDAGPLVIHPIEHATFVMAWNGKTIAVDPVGGALAFSDFPKADLILITDVHGDHLSVEVVAALLGPLTTIVGPAAVAEKFPDSDRERISVLGNGESMEWEGVVVEAIPMYNITAGREKFHVKGRGNGYVLTVGGKKIYIAGDTEDIPEMRALEDIDAAFVCMNLPYTMEVEAAADAVLDFRPKIVYPYHYRGKGGMSDLEAFSAIVAKDPEIEVRLLEWY
jgi:L-ascorbate metabolism protein UlaG (beta-lactamase superfamily)